MKKNVWILNHYATNMYFNDGGRHYFFAKELINKGYSPTIFCASTNHDTYKNYKTDTNLYSRKTTQQIPFVFVNTLTYRKNNYKRVLNMISFYFKVQLLATEYAEKYGKPDIILASSVHPLTLKAGLNIAKKFNIPCISEVRDLWPESLVAYGIINENTPLTKLLYYSERKLYEKSDSIIMTWQGGAQYIIDKCWDKSIDLSKINHISNGIILEEFYYNAEEFKYKDLDLESTEHHNVVYAGSIRKVNNLGMILDVAKRIEKTNRKIRFLIYGSGDEKKTLEERCEIENINNVIFKGRVTKKYIPSILLQSDATLLHNESTSLDKYGQSQNKLFEYLASGKPVIQTYKTGFSIIEKYNSGINIQEQVPRKIADSIISLFSDEAKMSIMGENAQEASKNYDFDILTNKLIKIIEKT